MFSPRTNLRYWSLLILPLVTACGGVNSEKPSDSDSSFLETLPEDKVIDITINLKGRDLVTGATASIVRRSHRSYPIQCNSFDEGFDLEDDDIPYEIAYDLDHLTNRSIDRYFRSGRDGPADRDNTAEKISYRLIQLCYSQPNSNQTIEYEMEITSSIHVWGINMNTYTSSDIVGCAFDASTFFNVSKEEMIQREWSVDSPRHTAYVSNNKLVSFKTGQEYEINIQNCRYLFSDESEFGLDGP